MNDHVHIVGFSGSLRKRSYNTLLLKSALELLPPDTTMDIVSIGDIPLYNADLDLPAADKRPAPVKKFRDAIASADGILIASPEYNYSIPGGLKNAIDWASRGKDSPLLHKPIALIGASTGMVGTARMQINFLNIYLYMDMKPIFNPEVLIARAEIKFDKYGNLIDEKAKELLAKKLEALKNVILQNKTETVHS
jgi:chromate reductase